MPNHLMSKIHLEGDPKRIQELLEHVKYDDGDIGSLDCNKIIPMPDSLRLTSGTIEWESIGAYLSKVNPTNMNFPADNKLAEELFNKICGMLEDVYGSLCLFNYINIDMSYHQIEYAVSMRYKDISPGEFIDLGAKYVSNLLKYGATSWYEWCCDNWGSKWSTYDVEPFVNNTMTFKTANAPIIPVVGKLGSMFPDIKITYKWADEDPGRNTGVIELFNSGHESFMPADDSVKAWDLFQECWNLSKEELENIQLELKNVDVENVEVKNVEVENIV